MVSCCAVQGADPQARFELGVTIAGISPGYAPIVRSVALGMADFDVRLWSLLGLGSDSNGA